MKKVKLATIIKRVVLISLLVAVVSVALIFIFAKYSAKAAEFDEADDINWDKDVLEGFEYYGSIIDRIKVFNKDEVDSYMLPWTYEGIDEATLTEKEKIDMARYQEEVDRITVDISQARVAILRSKEYAFYNKLAADASLSTEEFLEERLGVYSDDYEDLDLAFATVDAYLESLGIIAEKEYIIEAFTTNTDMDDCYDDLLFCGFPDDEDELLRFAKMITLDADFAALVKSYDQEGYDRVMNNLAYYDELLAYAANYKATLLDWNTYYKEKLLGFGGLATDYPNKPVLEKTISGGRKYQLWFNYYLTTFKFLLVDRDGNILQEWDSGPLETDDTANSEIQVSQKSTLEVSYSILKGQTAVFSTYEYSVSDQNKDGDAVTPNFAVKVDPETNTLSVWYRLEKRGIDYTYFPKYISYERMNELLRRNADLVDSGADVLDFRIADRTDATHYDESNPNFKKVKEARLRLLQGYYALIKTDDVLNEFGFDYYEFKTTYNAMSKVVRTNLYEYFYVDMGYTEEDLEADNAQFDQNVDLSDPEFEIGIKYTLTDQGLDVKIPAKSIKETTAYPITYINILPFFTATKAGIEGYTIIPDGSGVVMQHDNGNTNFSRYQKRVYTTDLSFTNYIYQGSTEELMFPMYGVINTGNSSGMLVYATSSGAQFQLTADVSGRSSAYNINYFSCYLREMKVVTLGQASYERKTLNKWTTNRSRENIVLHYEVMNENDLNYSALAKKYRDALISYYGIEAHDTTTTPTVDLDIVATYSYKDNFVGIPYVARDSLTTLDQLEKIAQAIFDEGIDNINVSLLGWRKQNLVDVTFRRMNISPLIGSKAKFEALLKNENNLTIYPYVNVAEVSKFQESFGKYHYTTHAADGDYAIRQPYDVNSNIFDKTKAKIYAISPRYYLVMAEQLVKAYKDELANASTLAVRGLGSMLAGDYKKNIESFKVNAVREQVKVLDYLTASGIDELCLYAPYDYAFKYVSIAKEVPYLGTQYEIVDYSIPFYQLVVNGLFDYSGESINANIEKGVTEHLMRIIETGSNISFTLTGDSSEKLLQTDYNNYYYTYYLDWIKDIQTIYDTLNDLGIYECELVGHERLSSNVYKVTYKNSRNTIEIYLNYTRNSFDVYGDGSVVVPPKNYLVA